MSTTAAEPAPRGGLVQVVGGWLPALPGVTVIVVVAVLAPAAARAAASQVYAPFVLVAGLLLVGLVADGDGLFALVGHRLAGLAPNGGVLFVGTAVVAALVTAVLNLDTSVVFLTPVVVYAARSRGVGEVPFVVACLLLANAGSLLLPGSNLTNLIVLGPLHLSGGQFLHRMLLPWVAAVVVTTAVIGTAEHRTLRTSSGPAGRPEPAVVGVGLVAVVVVTALVLVLRSPALPVAAVGVMAVGLRIRIGREDVAHVERVLGVPVLVALFGLAVGLGTLGRTWSGPAALLAHLDAGGTAVVAAATSVLVNNLPAAALLAARTPPHPFALLIGLDVGPNLFVTGSLAWVLWWRTVRDLGGTPPMARAVVLGLVSVPLAMAGALAAAGVTGPL